MMNKLLRLLLVSFILTSSMVFKSVTTVYAIAIPAEINKQFTPLLIDAGAISVLRVTVFNPNTFQLTSAMWTDNLVGVQPGLSIAPPGVINNTCGGSVTAVPTLTTLSLSGGTVPAQVGAAPGECYVEINVTSATPGNLINTIPANTLNSSGNDGGTPVTISNTTPASATLTVVAVVPPSLSKGFAPNTISMGNVSTLTITINNNDTNTNLTGTSFTDTLPANVILANPPFGATPLANCGASAALATTAGGNTIALTNATVTPGLNCVVTVNVTSAVQGVYINTIPAGPGNPGSIVTVQGVTNASPASAPLNVQPISITKQFNSTSFQAGGTNTLTITIQNPSASNYTGVNLSDILPVLPNTNLTYVIPSSATTTCVPGAASNTSTTVTLTGGTIPPNSSCTITVNVTTSAGATAATYTNTIPVSAVFIGSNPTLTNGIPATANVSVYAIGTGMAGSVKSFSIDPIDIGQNTRLRIDLFAPVDTNLTNFSMTDNLPAGVTVSNVNNLGVPTPPAISGCGALSAVLPALWPPATGATSIRADGATGTILAGARCRIDVWVTSSTPGTVTNIISPADISNTQNRHPSGNLTDTLSVNSAENLSVTKAFNPPTVNPGGLSTLTITLRNTYTSPLIITSLTDPLPGTVANGVVVAPGLDGNGNASTTCTPGSITAAALSQTITMTGGTVPAQVGGVPGICTITVTVQGNDSNATPSNRINIIPATNVSGTVQSTGVVINPTADAVATLRTEILTIGVVKGFNPVLVYGGAYSTMSVQLVNPNNITLTGIAFTDNMALLGAGMELANPVTFNVGTCGGVLTGNPGDSSFSFSGGSLVANSNCTLTLRVVMSVNGNLTNRIPAGAVTTFNGVSSTQPTEASLTNLPGASVSKSFDRSTILTGEYSTLTITIQNTSNIPLLGMALTDNLPTSLPTGLEIAGASAPPPSNGCGGSFSALAGSQTIELTGGSLLGNLSCTITVSVASSTPGIYVNTIPPGALTATAGGLPVSNNNPASATLVVNPAGEYSLGNRVWFDTDNSGTINGTEAGISGVRVELYQDNGGTPGVYDGTDTFLSFATTDASGYYRFDNLPAGEYVVLIPADNFRNVGAGDTVPGNPLSGYWSSGTSIASGGTVSDSVGPDADIIATDSDDNGVTSFTSNTVNYVSAQAVTLGPGTGEPTGETDLSPSGQGAVDNRADMTVDFGFYRVELGDLVFVDVNNNGTYDAGDTLLAGATVQLYSSNGTEINVGPDGILGTADDAVGGVVTGAGGTYLFSGLPAGNYKVGVTPPNGYTSTVDTAASADTTSPDMNINNNDNGIGTAGGQVLSNIVTLTPGSLGAASNNSVNNTTGTTTNPTLDFGFILASNFLKNITGTNQLFTNGSDVAIGEIITYQVSLVVPPGIFSNASLVDTMQRGLAFVGCDSISGVGLITDLAGGFGAACSTPTVDDAGGGGTPIGVDVDRRVTFNLGTVTSTSNATMIFTYRAVALDIGSNVDSIPPVTLSNSASFLWGNENSLGPVATIVSIVEPELTIDKSVNNNFISVGTEVTFTLVSTHTANSHTDAFDVIVTDILPTEFDFVTGSLTCNTGAQVTANCSYNPATRTITAVWTTFTRLGGDLRVQFKVIGNNLLVPGVPVTNVGSIEWTSLPGPVKIPQSYSPNNYSTERYYDPVDTTGVNNYGTNDSLVLNALGGGDKEGPGNRNGRNAQDTGQGSGGFLIPITGFTPGLITDLSGLPVALYDANLDLSLEIPRLKLNMPIVGAPLKNGTWDVNWLTNQAGWLEKTAFPGFPGNSVLTGHVTSSYGVAGPFASLYKLQEGDLIFIHTFGQTQIYKVRTVKKVRPNDISVLNHQEKPWLTLLTCADYDEKTNKYLSRIVVRAELIEVRDGNISGR